MAKYDEAKGVLTIKLVYYGPAQSGKITNLMRLHDRLQPELRGEMMAPKPRLPPTSWRRWFPLLILMNR